MLSVLCALSSEALALTSHQSGPSLDLAAGLGLRGAPVAPAVGGELALGWWAGTFDDQFAFGRYWLVQGVGRVDWRSDATALTPMLELRRGTDIIVAGLSWGVGGGAVVVVPAEGEAPPLGWTARASVVGRFRRTRSLALNLRAEAGADVIAGAPSFAGGLLVGFSVMRPAARIEAPDPTR